MFEFLKKKINDFTDKVKEKLEAKKEPEKEQVPAKQEQEIIKPQEKQILSVQQEKKPIEKSETKKNEMAPQKPLIAEHKEKIIAEKEPEIKKKIPEPIEEQEKIKDFTEEKPITEEELGEQEEVEEIIPEQKIEIIEEHKEVIPEKEIHEIKELKKPEARELKAKVGLKEKLFGFVKGKITISEKDTEDFFDELEFSLLESDVEQETSEAIVNQLKSQLVGKEISSGKDITEFLKNEIRNALEKIMETEKIDLLSMKKKPLVIMFLGPNGAGKTTTIAKIANYFLKNKKHVILAAGDTFRAAAIDQLQVHADRLGIKIVKHNYGSDPAAVAFDAVKAAEAKNLDVVLIDTAGRQDTNKNLMKELEKINRIVKPDIKIYVREAYTGQALLQQAKEFNEAIGIDGFVLTKIDADAKGGTAISLLYTLKKPILFVGVGQEYKDLKEFTPELIIERII